MKVPNGNLTELELSEADKLFTAQLLEEARKVSAQSKHRGKLGRRRSGNGKCLRKVLKETNGPYFCVVCKWIERKLLHKINSLSRY